MKTIVITGSTRGIGRGLADSFLAKGCRVVVNGRSQNSVNEAVAQLGQKHAADRVTGQAGDVTKHEDHQALWDKAVETFGKVDVWINNAGIGHPMQNVWEIPAELIEKVIDVDLKGVIFGSQVAVKNMIDQGHGHLYNMEGFGSNGRTRAGLSVYGSTKRGLRFLTRSLTAETKDTAVKVSALSPGIVITEFITDQYKDDAEGLEQAKRIFNILGDKVETVTPWLADQVLKNDKSGARFQWLTFPSILWRFMTAGFNKRNLFD